MRSFLRLYLLVTGCGAFIALTMPGLVIFGLFLFLLPGLILALMPTAFLYGAVFAALWWLARAVAGEWPAAGMALVGTFLILCAIPTAANQIIERRIAADRGEQIMPKAAIRLHGVVKIETGGLRHADRGSAEAQAWRTAMRAAGSPVPENARPLTCDSLCAAILFTPGVDAVLITAPRPRNYTGDADWMAFRIDRTPGCIASIDIAGTWGGFSPPANAAQLRTEWRTRASAGACILWSMAEPEADITITFSENVAGATRDRNWGLTDPNRWITRLAITDRSGVALRRTMVNTALNSVPLYIADAGGIENLYFLWARSYFSGEQQIGFFKPMEMLEKHTTLLLTPDGSATIEAARAQLAHVLADPARPASDPGFALTETVLQDMRENGLRPGDPALIRAIVADPRTSALNGIVGVIKKLGADAGSLRGPIIARLLRSPNRVLGDAAITSLPPGIFATPSADEMALLSDPDRRDGAPGLILRQTDRGPAAAPMLLDMLADVYNRRAEIKSLSPERRTPWSGPPPLDRTEQAVRSALTFLGPAIADQRPRLEALLNGRTDLTGRARTWHWEVTLVRMGASPESFEKPSSEGGSEADYHRRLRRDVERYQRNLDRRGM